MNNITKSVYLVISLLLIGSPVFASGVKLMFHYTYKEIHPNYLKHVVAIFTSPHRTFETYKIKDDQFVKDREYVSREFSAEGIRALSNRGYGGTEYPESSHYPVYQQKENYLLIGRTPERDEKIWVRMSENASEHVMRVDDLMQDVRVFFLAGEDKVRRFYKTPAEDSPYVEIRQPGYKKGIRLEWWSEKLDTVQFVAEKIVNGFVFVKARQWGYGYGNLANYKAMTGWIKIYDEQDRLTIWCIR